MEKLTAEDIEATPEALNREMKVVVRGGHKENPQLMTRLFDLFTKKSLPVSQKPGEGDDRYFLFDGDKERLEKILQIIDEADLFEDPSVLDNAIAKIMTESELRTERASKHALVKSLVGTSADERHRAN